MAASSASGANVSISVFATAALSSCLCWISPAMRCEKNSIGICSTCHRKELLPVTASFPPMRREYTARIHSTTICKATIPHMARKNPLHQSRLIPVSKRSKKILEKIGIIIPITDTARDVSTTNITATFVPCNFFFANDSILLAFPSDSKVSSGSNSRQTPVKDSSKVSMVTLYVPLAGSFNIALPFLNPFNTTK